MTERPRRTADGRAIHASAHEAVPGGSSHGPGPRPGGGISRPAAGAPEGAGSPSAGGGESEGIIGGRPSGVADPETTVGAAPPGLEAEALRQELAERNDQLLRLAADFENFRRRKAQELVDRSRYASEDAALAMLPVLDNLRRAIGHAGADGSAQQLQDGLRMVVAQFEQALVAVGVEPVETVGSPFDPAVHQAIGGEESDAVSEDTVIEELQPGYRLHDRLLRPALVRVAHPRRGGEGAAGTQP
ncbi:MAG: nucleotide exchange factor GrpE [Candidatus Dormibacteria bacterium]